MRAILIRAIDENKSVCVYRAKQSLNEKQESKIAIGQWISCNINFILMNDDIFHLI